MTQDSTGKRVVIKVSQLDEKGDEAREIGAWVIDEPIWNQLLRVFTQRLPSDTPGAVWIDLCDVDGDIISDEPVAIPAHQGQWMLRDWMKPRAREWKRVRVI